MALDLSRNEEHELAESVRAACDRLSTELDGGTQLWNVLCKQVGVTGIAVPEKHGGAGYGAKAMGVVAHELGRTLAAAPFLSFTFATGLLVDSAPEELVARTLPALIDGERTAAVVLTEDGGLWDLARVAVSGQESSGGWVVDGRARHVLDGSIADDFVVIASAAGELGLFLVDAGDERVQVITEDTLDNTRPMATVAFDDAPATPLQIGTSARAIIEANVLRALAVLSAEQVGTCERVLEVATDYASTRHQFGRAIGSFQAIKHKCADMLVDLEWARSASAAALQAIDDNNAESGWRSSMAKAVCSQALRDASSSNLQIHGGIGFTWEDSAHLYLKRARTDEVLFGTIGAHWDRVAALAEVLTA